MLLVSGEEKTIDHREFRDCMGMFATGVTVVLGEGPAGPAGMTVNSFTSVSLEPSLILVSLKHGSNTLRTVRETKRFTVSVLQNAQAEAARAFGRSKSEFPWEHVDRRADGELYVRDALASLSCETHALMPLGDHDVVVGVVRSLASGEGEPLIFHRGAFAHLGA
jgi:flavin reductase (DIM6/NTAB) family NADH-FMN oxidoreductase RutF